MAGEQKSNTTDTLSADLKALQDRVEKLTDKLNDTQREVVQLRAELGGQDKRLSDTVGRIGDVNIWLTIFAVIVAMAAIFGLWQASRRAADEARQWLKKNSVDLLNELKEDLAKHKANTAKAAEDVQNHFATLVTRAIDKSKPMSEAEQAELRRAEVETKDKPESGYTAKDWNVRAFVAYSNNLKNDAVFYWGKMAECADATATEIAIALYNKGVTLGELERWEDAIAVYDEVVQRFGTASEPELRKQVAKSFVNRGVTLGLLGHPEEEIAVYDEVDRRFGMASEPELRESVAQSLVNKGVRLGGAGAVRGRNRRLRRGGSAFRDGVGTGTARAGGEISCQQGYKVGRTGAV